MERREIERLMENIYTSAEAAEYLNISVQRLHQLVKDKQIKPIKSTKSVTLFYKNDLTERKISNFSNHITIDRKKDGFNIDVQYVRDAILYFTIQQYFNNSDKKTLKFIDQIKQNNDFNFHEGLQINIKKLATILNVTQSDFYNMYLKVKYSFQQLDEDVILVSKNDELYPKSLAAVLDCPPYLFMKGNIHLLDEKAVCVVGSRNASMKGISDTKRIVSSLSKRNIVVISGLAKGIDTAAHSTALQVKGKTIAVIGTPINQYYPKENKALQQAIEKEGLVVSQFPPCNPIARWNFPLRNATMSGLSLATIIMEAGETSGALKQADSALKQGRSVLIPQSALDNTLIKWPSKYVKKGASVFSTLKEAFMVLSQNNILTEILTNVSSEEVMNVEMD